MSTTERFHWRPREHTINDDHFLRTIWPTEQGGGLGTCPCCVRALIREVLAARRSGFVYPRLPDGHESLGLERPDFWCQSCQRYVEFASTFLQPDGTWMHTSGWENHRVEPAGAPDAPSL